MRVTLSLCVVVGLFACRQDMHDQPRFEVYEATELFDNAASSQAPVAGTVARGQLNEDALLYTGQQDGKPSTVFPFEMTAADLERGRERYNIYCSVCHDRAGNGQGMIVRRGFPQPTSFHEARLRSAPPGYFFSAITNGFGAMYSYRARVKPADRWRIVAYIRALQLSRQVPARELNAADLDALAKTVPEGT